MARDRTLTAIGVLTAAFLAQLAGHLLLKYYMPNAAVGGLGFLLVGLIFYYVLFVRRDPFGFVLVVYVCSHFSYADNQGGLWNLMAFGIATPYLLLNQRRKEFRRQDFAMYLLLGIFLLWNILGWVLKNPVPIIPELEGIAAFLGFILVFHLTSNMVITKERFRLFLTVTFFMLLYQFAVAVNQRYAVLKLNTPLIGGYSEDGTTIVHTVTSSVGTLIHFELFGEYGALMTCLLVPLLSSSFTQQQLRFGSNRIVIMIFMCLSFIMLATNRSATILFVLVIAAYYLVLPLRIFSSIDRVGRQLKLVAAFAILLPVVGIYVGLHSLETKFGSLASEKFTVEGVISGKDINRGTLITEGLKRLGQESWWTGFGYGIPRSNRWAWFGVDTENQRVALADYHSLYLSLPELYGWVGTLAFLSMIGLTWFRSLGTAMRYRRRKNFLLALAVGFAVFWGVFLANEYKISILRNPNYHMLFWIWLGLSNAVIRSIRYQTLENNEAVAVSPPMKKQAVKSGALG